MDHLQNGEPKTELPAAGATVVAVSGAAGGVSGGHGGQSTGGTGTPATVALGGSGASTVAGSSLAAGGTGTNLPSSAGSQTATSGGQVGEGGTATMHATTGGDTQSVGGTRPSGNGGNASGGSSPPSSGGTTSSGGQSITGGSNGQGGFGAITAAGSSGTKASTGQSGTTTAAGSSAVAGAPGAAGGPSATGGAKAMTYNSLGQSCADGVTCPTSVSCCTQIEVPAGTFPMGTNSDPNRSSDESPQHNATLDRFLMDKFEVTVGRFRRFVQAFDGTMPPTNSGAHPKVDNSGWQVGYDANMPASSAALQNAINCNTGQYQAWTNAAGVRETMPMNCVSWYVALAFCIWDGGRLPTEAEWEMAAASGASDARFPWGSSDPDPATQAVMNCLGDGTSGCAPTDLLAVGSRLAGANQWGHQDLAGSLWEWTLDYYDATYYQAISSCNNCANLAASTPRVIRGGSFTSTLNAVRASGRASKPPINADAYTGLRCVRSP